MPCPQESGKEASLKQLDEFALALELRCRIGGINCRRLGKGREQEAACCKKQDRNSRKRRRELENREAMPALLRARHHCVRFGGCVHATRLRQRTSLTYRCPLQGCIAQELEEDVDDILWEDLADISMVCQALPAFARMVRGLTYRSQHIDSQLATHIGCAVCCIRHTTSPEAVQAGAAISL